MPEILNVLFSTIRYSLLVVNFFFVLTGIIVIIAGAVIQAEYSHYYEFLDGQFFAIPTFLIVIGVFIFLIAGFGCFSAYKENYYLILAYAGLMLIIFILELAAGISGYILRNTAIEVIENSLIDSIALYGPNNPAVTELWDEVQRLFECCGVTTYLNWFPIPGGIPLTCCPEASGILDQFNCNSTNVFIIGCGTEFGGWAQNHAQSLGIVGIVICCFQLLLLAAACYLARKSKYASI